MYNDPQCTMAVDSAGAPTEPGSGITKFMVIPMVAKTVTGGTAEYAGPSTFHVCGDAQ
jgi:hypothetical protein